ncbi:MAG: hypothetical protein M3082_05955 [Candidatus Dormibacteraeota bacterium]|nr:hypothetical protein [Candidatus Dormibacteraeota bacterium]
MPDKPIASGGKLHILHGGEERFGFHLGRLCEQLPRTRLKDVRQRINDLALPTKPDNVAILVHEISFPFGDSGVRSPTPIRRPSQTVITQIHP